MSSNEKYRAAARVVLSLLVLTFGICLSGLAFLRLGTGPFPYATGRILKLVLGILLALGGAIAVKKGRWRSVVQFVDSLGNRPRTFASFTRWFALPAAEAGSYSLYVRLTLTLVMFGGLGMMVLSFIKPPPGFELGFWHRSQDLRVGGLVLAVLSGILRSSKRSVARNRDWPKRSEMLLLMGLAVSITAVDIYFSQRIGALASPPRYDGVAYLLDAKRAFLQLGAWKQHPIHSVNVLMGNRYPVWMALLVFNFRLFGVGEWQGYAVRFWPTLTILATTFWVVRRRAGSGTGWAAALFTALLPTLSLNLRSAAAGHQLFFVGYLTDLRPDLLFAALLTLAVVLIVEHAQTFDRPTAILAGIAAALAVLTKASAMAAVLLACGSAGVYVLFTGRRNMRSNLQTSLWALLAFVFLLTPWLLTGGLQMTIDYVRYVLTVDLPLYSNANPTFRSEFTYYYPLLIDHMGWQTVAMVLASPLLLFGSLLTKGQTRPAIGTALVYFLTAVALYGLVSISLAKNYFLGLPSYLVLWVFCWVVIVLCLEPWPTWSTRIGWSLFSLAIITVGVVSVLAAQNLVSWQGHESEEGRQDRAVMQQMALDLRELLSNDDTFLPVPAYGNPATLLFYMPDRQGEFPQSIIINGLGSPPIQEFMRQTIEPAKAVLIYEDGNKESSFKGYMPSVTFPYYRAVAAWVQRPGSAHHLRKTYQFYRAPGGDQAAIEMYVRDDPR